jgi:hypothetical protein
MYRYKIYNFKDGPLLVFTGDQSRLDEDPLLQVSELFGLCTESTDIGTGFAHLGQYYRYLPTTVGYR